MRSPLKEGTWVQLPDGGCYAITGTPVGEGGTSLIYPAVKLTGTEDGHPAASGLKFVLKECYPYTQLDLFIRTPSGEVVPKIPSEQLLSDLHTSQELLLNEQQITAAIYDTATRLTPILSGSDHVRLSFDKGKTFIPVGNTVTVMESLSSKGRSLRDYLAEGRTFSLIQALRVTEQILFAVQEVHRAGYLHLDLQDGNIFLRGSLTESSSLASLIDLGSARKLLADGKCDPIDPLAIFATEGLAAPEITRKQEGMLRLGPEADIYSIGCLLLLFLTGQTYHPQKLYARKDGHYLSRARLNRLHCPGHLRERLQQILAKALENAPQDRYPSCKAMLEDLSDLIAALQPYRSDLSQVAFDAFICYKHGPIDSAAAVALQKGLEHLHVPKDLRKHKKKIQKVFVDEGELSSCADLGLQIQEALKNAGFLIVICSPETKTSPWVDLEIRTFLKYHSRSRILAVMTGGEPEEIFPEALLDDPERDAAGGKGLGRSRLVGNSTDRRCLADNGPDGENRLPESSPVLAADARGQDLHAVLKKLKKDALLRIAAPILGTTYDSLKQRHRTYRMQQLAAFFLTAVLVLAAFTIQTLWQSAQVRKQYQQARINQARYLSRLSQELLLSGDRDKALLTALAIGPEKDSDGAVVPEQMYALNNALVSYKDGYAPRYDPAYTGEADGVTFGTLSPKGTYYLVIDKDHNAVILSAETGKRLFTVTPAMVKSQIQDLYPYHKESFDHIHLLLPISEQQFAAVLDYCIAVVDLKARSIVRTFPLEGEAPAIPDAHAQKGTRFAYGTSDGKLWLYDLGTGKRTAFLDLSQALCDTARTYSIESISLGEEDDVVALGLSYDTKKAGYPDGARPGDSVDKPAGLVLYRPKEQELTILSSIQTEKVLWVDADHVAAIHFTPPVSGALQTDIGGGQNRSYYQALYDAPSGMLLSKSEALTIRPTVNTGLLAAPLKIQGKTYRTSIAWIRGTLTVLDVSSGKTLIEMPYRPDIIGVSAYGASQLSITFNNGTVQLLTAGARVRSQEILSLSTDTTSCSFDRRADRVLLISDSRILFCDRTADPEMETLELPELSSGDMMIAPSASGYAELAGETFRYLCLYQCTQSPAEITEILVFPVRPAAQPDAYQRTGPGAGTNARTGIGAQEDTGSQTDTGAQEDTGSQTDTGAQADTGSQTDTGAQADTDGWIYRYKSPQAGYAIRHLGFGYDPDTGRRSIAFTELSPDGRTLFRKADLFTGETIIQTDLAPYEKYRSYMEDGIMYSPAMDRMFLQRTEGILPMDISQDTPIPSRRTLFSRQTVESAVLSGNGRYLAAACSDRQGGLCLYTYDLETDICTELTPDSPLSIDTAKAFILPGSVSSLLCFSDGNETIYVFDQKDGSLVFSVDTGTDDCQAAFFDHDRCLLIAGQTFVHLYDLENGRIVHTYTDPDFGSHQILTDSSSCYFAIKDRAYFEDTGYDPGTNRQSLRIFYVDEDHIFYPYGDVDFGHASFSGGEIASMQDDHFSYSRLYDYAYLKEAALRILDGRTLTEGEAAEYFIQRSR